MSRKLVAFGEVVDLRPLVSNPADEEAVPRIEHLIDFDDVLVVLVGADEAAVQVQRDLFRGELVAGDELA